MPHETFKRHYQYLNPLLQFHSQAILLTLLAMDGGASPQF